MASTEQISEQINLNSDTSTVGTEFLNTQAQDGSISETNKLSQIGERMVSSNSNESNSSNTESG